MIATDRNASSNPEPVARLRPLLDGIAARAAALDVDGRFPTEDVQALRHAGLLSAFLPGHPDDAEAMLDVLRLIGGANLSLGRIYEGHLNAIKLVNWYGAPTQQSALAHDLAAGRLHGIWATEAPPGVRLVPEGEGWWLLQGAKTFATGGGHVERMLITARLPDGRKQLVLVPRAGPGRDDASVWRTRGMRATVSGRYDFSDIRVDGNAFIGGPEDYEREPRFTAGAWRFCAVQLGAVEALVSLLRDRLRETGGDADPLKRSEFGAAIVAARTAGLWVHRSALLAEALCPESIAVTLMTRGVVERAGIDVMELVARAVGTRAFFTDEPIDRITRDLSLYLRQAGPHGARDRAAAAWLEADVWGDDPWW